MAGNNGVIYTKKWVVKLVLDIAGYTADLPLWKNVVVEPSCGHGSFVREIVERLIESAKRDGKFNANTLQNCVVCYELDENSVNISHSIAKEILILNGMNHEEAEKLASMWIIHGDYLLADAVPCDYVIGNPPYLRATDIPAEAREKYCYQLSAMTKGCDIFVGFIEKGVKSLKDKNGVLSFICADRWMQNQYGKKLRGLISKKYHLDTIVRMHGIDAFETEVSAYPSIIRIDKLEGKIKYADCKQSFDSDDALELKIWLQSGDSDYVGTNFSAMKLNSPKGTAMIPLSEPNKIKNILNLMNQFPSLEDSGVKLGIGLATGKDDVYIVKSPNLVEEERMLPMFNMRDWRRRGNTDSNWLVNPWNQDGSLVDLSDFPRLKLYFETHKSDITRRHVAKKNQKAWYRTIDKINWQILGAPMLLFPDMAMSADPVYSDGTRYPCHNCYWLVSDHWDIKVLGGLLMSDIAESFIDALGVKMRGGTKRFQAQYLRLIHVPNPKDIPDETAEELKLAFETNDRAAASRAALVAYGLEGK